MFKYIAIFTMMAALTGMSLLTGCGRNESQDSSDLRDPLLRQAHARMREGDKDAALDSLQRALNRKPDLAQAHLEAALLYDNYKKDYIRAIYHYSRYLELGPRDDKHGVMVEELLQKAKISYAATLVNKEYSRDHRLRDLQQENERLRGELREVRANLAQQRRQAARGVAAPVVEPTAEPVASTAPVAAALPAPTSGGVEPALTTGGDYRVQAGDTLSVIAARMYQDPRKWNLIYEANRDRLTSPEHLVVGQKIFIPQLPKGNSR